MKADAGENEKQTVLFPVCQMNDWFLSLRPVPVLLLPQVPLPVLPRYLPV